MEITKISKRILKLCTTCKIEKDISEFSYCPRGKYKRNSTCKACSCKKTLKLNGRPYGRYLSYKRQAGYRGLEFNLTFEQFFSFWGLVCHYCGSDIDGIGLDRIDNNQGYNMKNVYSCCETCNKIKLQMSYNEFLTHIKKIYNNHFNTAWS